MQEKSLPESYQPTDLAPEPESNAKQRDFN